LYAFGREDACYLPWSGVDIGLTVVFSLSCVSLYSSEEQDRMGAQETVHIRIKRRRSQIRS